VGRLTKGGDRTEIRVRGTYNEVSQFMHDVEDRLDGFVIEQCSGIYHDHDDLEDDVRCCLGVNPEGFGIDDDSY
jgi:hypothetical protein